MLTKKEAKLVKKIENKYRIHLYKQFCEIMLKYAPFDETEMTSIKVPTKKKMKSVMESKLNPDKNLIVSGIISQFLTERYEVMK